MRAAVFHGARDVRTVEVPKPAIKANQILVRVKACGICGSDLHMYKLGLFSEMLCQETPGGGIPGHEFAGEVAEVGSLVEGVEVGERVAAFAMGGMAEYVPVTVIPGFNVQPIPDEISDDEAATLEPLANSLHAALKGNPSRDENAVVFGAGIIGLGIVQCLRALEVDLEKLVVVDVSDRRLGVARDLGADATINAAREAPDGRLRELLGTAPMRFAPGLSTPAVDIVYDCVGYVRDRPEPQVIEQALALVKPGTGRIVVHGVFEAEVTLNLMPMVGKEVSILGSYGFQPPEVGQSIELMRTRKVGREGLISHRFPLDRAREAFETACAVEESVKVLLKP